MSRHRWNMRSKERDGNGSWKNIVEAEQTKRNENNDNYGGSLSIVSNYVQESGVSRLVQLLAVKLSTAVSKSGSGLLRGDVALRLCHHLITDQELAHSSAAEEGRIEMHVEVTGLDFLGRTFKRCLMKTHACFMSVTQISQNMLLNIL